jgi:hypothetical protein
VYQIYRTADGRYLAAAPIEEKFWENFARLIELPHEMRDPTATRGGHRGGGWANTSPVSFGQWGPGVTAIALGDQRNRGSSLTPS